MTTTIYVLRAFGGTLIIQTITIALPTTTVIATCRDGTVKATSH